MNPTLMLALCGLLSVILSTGQAPNPNRTSLPPVGPPPGTPPPVLHHAAPPATPAPVPAAPPPTPVVAPFPAAWTPGATPTPHYAPLAAPPSAGGSPLPGAGVASTSLGGGHAGLVPSGVPANPFGTLDSPSKVTPTRGTQRTPAKGGSSTGSRRHQVEKYSSRIRSVQNASAAGLAAKYMYNVARVKLLGF